MGGLRNPVCPDCKKKGIIHPMKMSKLTGSWFCNRCNYMRGEEIWPAAE